MSLLHIFDALKGQFDGPQSEAMPITSPKEPGLSFSSVPSDREVQENYLMQLLQNPPTPTKPKKQKTGYRTDDLARAGVALLIGGLTGGGKGIEAAASSYAGAKESDTQRKNKEHEEDAAFNDQKSIQDWQSKVNASKTMLGFLDDKEQREAVQRREAMSQEDKLRDDLRMVYQIAYQKFSTAKDKATLTQAAQQMRQLEASMQRLGIPIEGTTPDDAAVDLAWRQRSGIERDRIRDNYRLTEGQYIKQYGYVPEDAVAGMEKLRQQGMAELKMYGLDDLDSFLPEVSSEKSLAVKLMDEKKREFEKRYGQDEAKRLQEIAKWKAEYELRKKSLAIQARNSEIGAFNADTSRMNYEARMMKDAADKTDSEIDKEITKNLNEITKLRGQADGQSDFSKRRDLWAKINGLQRLNSKLEQDKIKAGDVPGIDKSLPTSGFGAGQANDPKVFTEQYRALAIDAIKRLGKDPAAVRAKYEKDTGRKADF